MNKRYAPAPGRKTTDELIDKYSDHDDPVINELVERLAITHLVLLDALNDLKKCSLGHSPTHKHRQLH